MEKFYSGQFSGLRGSAGDGGGVVNRYFQVVCSSSAAVGVFWFVTVLEKRLK